MIRLRVLGVAAGSGRVAYVFFIGTELKDWGVSEDAAASPGKAKKAARRWIKALEAQVLVTPDFSGRSTKGRKTRDLIEAVTGTARRRQLICVALPHTHDFPNKYAEASALAQRYPDIAGWLPEKRRFYDKEPRNIVLFEALSIAEHVSRSPAVTIGRVLG